MKKKIFVLLAGCLLSSFFFYACKESTTTEPPPPDTENYFPNNNGNYYKYNIERTDSNNVKTVGTRSSTYQGSKVLSGVTYQIQVDTLTVSGFSTTSESYFRKTDLGVYFFIDTTGLSETIPDTLLQYMTMDNELAVLSFPVQTGRNWSVFKMTLQYGPLTFTIIDVQASYMDKENVTILVPGEENKEAYKIKYTLTLNIPNPQNPLQTIVSKFEADAWIAGNIGIVKWEGNGTILNAFAGGGISFADTTSSVSQTLAQYSIK